MTFPTSRPPKSEKANQHYIPRWWLRDFAGPNGALYALRGAKATPVDVGKIFSEDWIYTLFDEWWRPSDILEDALSKIEGDASKIFRSLGTSTPTQQDWDAIIWFVSLCVCRHPEMMGRSHELGKEYGVFLGAVDDYATEEEFRAAGLSSLGADPGLGVFDELRLVPSSVREASILHLIEMLPTDARLPQTDALQATSKVDELLRNMDCRLLSSPSGSAFVFGDRPFPPKDICRGFTVPLSKAIALEFLPCVGSSPIRGLSAATAAEVSVINESQAARAKGVLVGPKRAQLEALGPVPRP